MPNEFSGPELVSRLLPPRRPDTHKGFYGKAFLLCGATGYAGAAFFAAQGSVRSGAGLVTLMTPAQIHTVLSVKLNEAMVFPAECDSEGRLSLSALPKILERAAGADVCLAGCGLGRSGEILPLLSGLLSGIKTPAVLDADGINAFCGNIDLLKRRPGLVLTPHDGELSRLLGGDILMPGEDRPAAARRISKMLGAVLVMKGHRSVVASPDGRVFVNSTGNPGMARGGSGDLLSGIITGLIAQNPDGDLFRAAAAGVYLHGLAGDITRDALGEVGMTPTDMLSSLPEAIRLCRG